MFWCSLCAVCCLSCVRCVRVLFVGCCLLFVIGVGARRMLFLVRCAYFVCFLSVLFGCSLIVGCCGCVCCVALVMSYWLFVGCGL